jgi:hypothetical protein
MKRSTLVLAALALFWGGAGRTILIRACLCAFLALGVLTPPSRAGFMFTTPDGVSPGSQFIVVIDDNVGGNAQSAKITDYEQAIATHASGIIYQGGVIGLWKIIGATPTANDATDLFTSSLPVYDIKGNKLSSTGVAYINGQSPDLGPDGLGSHTDLAFTGLLSAGTTALGAALGQPKEPGQIFAAAILGQVHATLSSTGLDFESGAESDVEDYYGYSTFTAPAAAAAPEPSSITLAFVGLGSLNLLGYGWRRRNRAAA